MKYKVELEKEELDALIETVERRVGLSSTPSESLRNALKKLEKAKPLSPTPKQLEAVKKATETRVKKTRRKIETAINQLRLENRPITMYAVAKVGRLSPNTVKKYKDLIKAAEAERQRNQPIEKTGLL